MSNATMNTEKKTTYGDLYTAEQLESTKEKIRAFVKKALVVIAEMTPEEIKIGAEIVEECQTSLDRIVLGQKMVADMLKTFESTFRVMWATVKTTNVPDNGFDPFIIAMDPNVTAEDMENLVTPNTVFSILD